MKFFYSLDKVVEIAPKMWREYWTEGDFEVVDYDEQKKNSHVTIKNFNLHPIYCVAMEGFLGNMIRLVTGGEKVTCRETTCPFKDSNEKNHNYLIEWGTQN